jgi:hypothetical protein
MPKGQKKLSCREIIHRSGLTSEEVIELAYQSAEKRRQENHEAYQEKFRREWNPATAFAYLQEPDPAGGSPPRPARQRKSASLYSSSSFTSCKY